MSDLTETFDRLQTQADDCPSGEAILDECLSVAEMLIDKNRKYGDSALDPGRIFSESGPAEQIRVRIDDKIARLQSGQLDDTEDVERDLLGYLILLQIAEREDE